MRVGNHAKAEQLIKNYISNDFFINIYNSDLYHLAKEKRLEMLVYLLKAFEEDLNSEKLTSSLIFYLYYQSSGEFRERLDDEFEIPHSLSEVRSFYRSNRYGKVFPFVWGPSIFNDSSQKEYIKYINKTSVYKELLKGKKQNLLFYRNLSNIPKKQNKTIIERLKSLMNSNSFLDQYLFWELVNDDTFYKFITAQSKIKIGIVTKGKRNTWKKLLEEEKLKSLAVWGLLSLGDIQENYLQALKPNHE